MLKLATTLLRGLGERLQPFECPFRLGTIGHNVEIQLIVSYRFCGLSKHARGLGNAKDRVDVCRIVADGILIAKVRPFRVVAQQIKVTYLGIFAGTGRISNLQGSPRARRRPTGRNPSR